MTTGLSESRPEAHDRGHAPGGEDHRHRAQRDRPSSGRLRYLLFHLSRIVTLLIVTLFFTVVLTPAVDYLQHRAHLRRGISTAIVFLLGLAVLAGLTYVFVRPLVSQGQKFADDLPHYLRRCTPRSGTVGHLVKRFKLESYVRRNSKPLQNSIKTFGSKGSRSPEGSSTASWPRSPSWCSRF